MLYYYKKEKREYFMGKVTAGVIKPEESRIATFFKKTALTTK
jgi:hypothetical protein